MKNRTKGAVAPGWHRKRNGDIVRDKPKTPQQVQKERDSLLKLLSDRDHKIAHLMSTMQLGGDQYRQLIEKSCKLEEQYKESLEIIKLKNQETEELQQRLSGRNIEISGRIKRIEELEAELGKRNKYAHELGMRLSDLLWVIQTLASYLPGLPPKEGK